VFTVAVGYGTKILTTRTSETFPHHPCTSIEIFSILSGFSTIWWCPEKFLMISLMVQELSCWQTTRQTDRQTDKQTDTVDNNTTLAVQVVIIQLLIISHLYSATHKATHVLQWEQYVVRIATMSYAQELAFCRKNWRATHKTYVQYIPPTPTGRNCFVASAVWTRIRNKLVTVSSCRRCEHTRWQL